MIPIIRGLFPHDHVELCFNLSWKLLKQEPHGISLIVFIYFTFLELLETQRFNILFLQTPQQMFSCEFYGILRIPFLQNTSGRLLLTLCHYPPSLLQNYSFFNSILVTRSFKKTDQY